VRTPRRSFDALTQPLDGVHAIEASAGTGKTHSITLLWLRLLVERRLRVEQVLVTTFTRAATAELRERLLASLRRALDAAKGEAHGTDDPEAKIVACVQPRIEGRDLVRELATALSSFDLAPIHTIHGFCQSLISRHTLELGCDPGMELVEDAQETLEEIVGDRLMREAEMGFLRPQTAKAIARQLAHELGVPDARIHMPSVKGDPSPDAWAKAKTALLRWQPKLTAELKALKLGNSTQKTERVILALAEARQNEAISATARTKLQRLPALARAVEQAESSLDAMRAASTVELAQSVRREFPARKSEAGLRTFDDILLTVHRALEDGDDGPLARTIRDRFKAAIVDECQDSDGIQIAVFKRLFRRAESFLVIGDPKQSIYRFRGADLSSYQSLVADAARAPEMTVNYRSDPALVETLNGLYAPRPELRGGTATRPIRYVDVSADAHEPRITDARVKEPVLLLWSQESDRSFAKRDLAQQTAEEYRRLLDEHVTLVDRETKLARPLCASDLAVLAKEHDDLALVRYELQKRGIPCEQAAAGLGSVWKCDEAIDVQAWLEAVHALEERADPFAAMLAFAATPLLCLSAAELDALRNDPSTQAKLAEKLISDRDRLRYGGPLPLMQHYWADVERLAERLGSRDGERRVTNWRQLGCLLQAQWATGRPRAGDLALWLGRMRGQEDDAAEGTLMKLETDRPAVQLATIFTAKGLEYPVVCCPFLWHVKSRAYRRRTPVAVVRRPEGTLVDIGSTQFDDHLEKALAQEDDEQQRLLYVGLTRARHRLYVGLAPVDEGGKGNENGAERSALTELLGLTNVDKSEWKDRCGIPRLAPVKKQVHASSSAGPADPETELAPLPPAYAHRGVLTRCSSYSALTRSEDLSARDHDPEDRTEMRRDPGLLDGLNLTGNRLGQRVHSLLEEILGNGRPLEEVTTNMEPAWKTALCTILTTPIPLGSERVTLLDVRPRAIAEMHAMLPVRAITAASLSQALLRDPLIAQSSDRRTWADQIARFSFSTLHGFFQGYIDLIFEHRGRFYIVDYKTNALPGYDPASLEEAMLHHHYVLQARLYAVALHRHLRATLRGYDPDEHLGGCAYLFVRGFPRQGIWFERASAAAIDALDELFAEASS
jgi:exodeoxyribonuclease V beta subunit